jgi:excisionase family DNA binding protein
MTDRLALSEPEAAARIGVSERQVRTLIRDGEIAALHIGRRVLIRVAELERYLLAQQDAETARRTSVRRLVRAR